MKARTRFVKSGRVKPAKSARKVASAVERQRLAEVKARNQVVLQLLREALEDESGYQEAAWPRLKEAMEQNRLSERRRFSQV